MNSRKIGEKIVLRSAIGLMVVAALLTSCTSVDSVAVKSVGQGPHLYSREQSIFVSIEIDRLNVAERFMTQFRDAGLALAPSPAEAKLLLSGAYSADYDVFHERLNWAQFKLTEKPTGTLVHTLESGQSGLGSAFGVFDDMAKKIISLFPAAATQAAK